MGLKSVVRFLGPVPEKDLPPLYSGAAVFVFPSLYEGFGLPVLEAMACGTPVITFAHGALSKIVAHGETGLLVPPGDERALAAAMVELLNDRERSQRLGVAGRVRVERFFTAAQTARSVEAVYSHLLDLGGSV